MQPVALNANKELYSAEYQSIAAEAQAMYESGEFNSLAEAQNYVNDAFQMYMNPYQSISSGSTLQKWTSANVIQSGQVDSPTAWLRNLRGNTETAYSWAGGDSLVGSVIESAIGGRSYRNINVSKAGETNSLVDKYTNKTTGELDKIYENQVKNADDFNTTSQKWSTWFENATTWIGDIKASIGDKMWNIGKVIIEGIVGGITAYLGGKFLIKTAGSAIGKAIKGTAGAVGGEAAIGGAKSAGGGLLATGGGVAISAVAISALALAIGSAVADKMWDSSGEHGKKVAEEELKGTKYEGNSAAQSLLSAVHTQNDAGWFQKEFGNVGSGISMMFSNMFQGKADKNKNFLQWAIQSGALGDDKTDDSQQLGRLLTLAMIYAQNRLFRQF